MLIAACISAIGLIPRNAGSAGQAVQNVPTVSRALIWITLGLLTGLAFLIFQTLLEYRRRTHDPTWILRYQEQFDSSTMIEKRAAAADVLLSHKGKLAEIEENGDDLEVIDDVLDFFEDLGFYESGDQVSPEVVHHHFYHWIRGYWHAARPYIEAWRKRERTRWNHIEKLFEKVTAIESSETKHPPEELVMSGHDVEQFLRAEIAEREPNNGR